MCRAGPCYKPVCRLVHHRCMLDVPASQVLPAVQRALANPAAAPATRGAARLSPEPIMADPRQEAVAAYFRRSQQAVERVSSDGKFVAAAVAVAERIARALKDGGKVLLAGNGGSAADAQHIAAEFVGRFVNDRAPLLQSR